MDNPIDRIEWVPAASLKANDYNPNVVLSREMKLLELSILKTGWVQPILVDEDNNIIDGFHRWRLSQDSKKMLDAFGGHVPVARLKVDRAEAIMLTVRMNRAKGTHVAVRMADLVVELVEDHGVPMDDIAEGIGATKAEVELLRDNSLFKTKKLAGYKYSKAWVPREERIHGPKPDSV